MDDNKENHRDATAKPVRITNLGNSSVYVHVGAKGMATAYSQEVKAGQTIIAGAARQGGDTSEESSVNSSATLASQSQAAQPTGDLVEKVRAAMIRAYDLGQKYWQQADSEYESNHKKADVTAGRFIELNDDLCATVVAHIAGTSQATKAQAEPVGLRETLQAAKSYIAAGGEESGYGFARPTNPNHFHPDAESCSAEEIAAHKAACEAYDKGEYTPERGSEWVGSIHILRAPWGIGSYTMTDPAAANLVASIDKLLAAPVAKESQPLIGKLLDEFSALPVLWGLNEPGALVRHSDVFKMLAAAGKTYLAAPLAKEALAVPEGWKLVPVKPTLEMLDRGHHQIDFDRTNQNTEQLNHPSQTDPDGAVTSIEQDMRDAWAAMLAAAPQAPVAKAEQADSGPVIEALEAMIAETDLTYKKGVLHEAIRRIRSASVAKEATKEALPFNVIVDPNMPPNTIRLESGQHSVTLTDVDFGVPSAAKEVETGVQHANVLPPFAAPAGQREASELVAQPKLYARLMEMSGIIRADGRWTGNEFAFAEKSESDVAMLDDILGDALRLAAEPPVVQSSTAGSAKGGNTNADSSDRAPTTSTVSAPDVLDVLEQAAKAVESLPCSRDDRKYLLRAAETIRSLKAEGAQAAPEEVRKSAERWHFMMRIADNEEGPESKAMDEFRQDTFDAERPKSVQLTEMVDAARDALKRTTSTDKGEPA